ncbi:helix-turn-helix domain-containing protein [Streptomyces griseofuscus]
MARERAAYFLLMEQGYSTREAARIVGINLRTGKRWRNGWHSPPRGQKAVSPIYPVQGQAPTTAEELPSAPSRYLQEHDRIHIADRLREKASVRQIAAELGRSPSTISREIRRNRRPMPRGGFSYQPFHAHRRAERRRPRPKTGKIGQNGMLAGVAVAGRTATTRVRPSSAPAAAQRARCCASPRSRPGAGWAAVWLCSGWWRVRRSPGRSCGICSASEADTCTRTGSRPTCLPRATPRRRRSRLAPSDAG